MKNSLSFFLLIFLGCGVIHSQNELDTVYIKFDSIHHNMQKSKGYNYRNHKNGKKYKRLDRSYSIDEIVRPNPHMYSTEYKFYHIPLFDFQKDNKDGLMDPLVLYKGIDFLNEVKLLDSHFFETTKYIDVCKTFEKPDSREPGAVIFVIDVDEIKNDTVVLREVNFRRPVKE